ncbi:hypothetical protein JW796_02240 [Candidatus Dojkabacteria bacterium]|nr:hypothetical protein [Candidatus Dojkabacteria bacterium]
MKRKPEKEEVEHKEGITIDTNLHQIVAIIVIFLAMFVLPVELYTLYKNNKEVKPVATYTGEIQGVSITKTSNPENTHSKNDVLGAVDSIIPKPLKTVSQQTATYILYSGIASLALALIILATLLIKKGQ